MYLTATYTYHFPPAWGPYQSLFKPTAIPLAWIIFTLAWIGQFIGHGVFERRAPALKDNLVQGGSRDDLRKETATGEVKQALILALVTAPFFVHLEMMFEVFGCKSVVLYDPRHLHPKEQAVV
jgi:uncharacterized membrane protein YGL010W